MLMSEKFQGKRIRVVIADDHAMVRDGLRRSLAFSGLEVVAEARDGLEAVALVRKHSPDILLLDLAMPTHPGLEALQQLHEEGNPVRIIILTADIKPQELATAIESGARGLVMKSSATDVLVKAIHTVVAGSYWVGLQQVSNLNSYLERQFQERKSPRRTNTYGLTPRELQVVSAVVSARSNKAIATQLEISEDTVKHHLSNVFDKTGVSTRVELVVFAYEHKLPLGEND
jgi:two-component system, NarL family, nitrate/nitrite response regulator NarL